jgi:nicotinamidase/pyrazinamidase
MAIVQSTSALLLIDLQPDFMPGGALPVAGGDEILPTINALAQRFDHVILTQDWHPQRHISFATSHTGREPYQAIQAPYGPQTLWPDHCLQHTSGAALHPLLDIPHAELILRKGFRPHIDSYSAFLENDHTTPTGLAGYLRERGLYTLFLAGLAYDVCVRFSALDGKSLGFETLVLEDACRPVDLAGTIAETNAAFAAAQIPRIHSATLS